jgi:hypothetical protein
MALALICICIGLFATISNGVTHSESFSAMIATTRNTKLDRLVERSFFGALPLGQMARKQKLRFGELADGNRRMPESRMPTGHIAFGFEDEVINLRKNVKYT